MGGVRIIGSNFVRPCFNGTDEPVVNLDSLTYAGNLADLQNEQRHIFVRGDIAARVFVADLLAQHRPGAFANFAAEPVSIVRSRGQQSSSKSNLGSYPLLEGARILESAG